MARMQALADHINTGQIAKSAAGPLVFDAVAQTLDAMIDEQVRQSGVLDRTKALRVVAKREPEVSVWRLDGDCVKQGYGRLAPPAPVKKQAPTALDGILAIMRQKLSAAGKAVDDVAATLAL
jgi:hypothetical protein